MTNTTRNCFQHINHENPSMARICKEVRMYNRLSNEKKAELFLQYIAGGRLSEKLRMQIYYSERRIILWCIGMFYELPCFGQEDMYSVGGIALYEAIAKFEMNEGVHPFFKYASTAIVRAIADEIKKYSRSPLMYWRGCNDTDEICEFYYKSVTMLCYNDERTLEEEYNLAYNDYNDIDKIEATAFIREALKFLDPKDRYIVEQKHGMTDDGFERSDVTIGKRFGISGQAVGKHYRHAIKQLRQIINYQKLCA